MKLFFYVDIYTSKFILCNVVVVIIVVIIFSDRYGFFIAPTDAAPARGKKLPPKIVELNKHESVAFASPVGMMKVSIEAILPGAAGVLGTHEKSGMIGRNGQEIENGVEMGLEWQVGPEDHPMMSRTSRAPQYPTTCVLPPEAPARRLGEDAARRRTAEEACAVVFDPEELEDCIYDVVQTGDPRRVIDYLE